MIELSINENPYAPASLVKNALLGLEINRYPHADYDDLKQALTDFLNLQLDASTFIKASQLVFGNGSDELISLAMQSLLEPGDAIVCATPCFSEYIKAAKNARLSFFGVPMTDSLLPCPSALLSTAKAKKAKLMILCRPDNPSGQMLSEADLDWLLSQFDGFIVLDEAYIEFSHSPFETLTKLSQYPKLIILRTFSKAFGLAGLRIGYLLASPETAQIVDSFRHPYNVNIFALAVARALLEAPDQSLATIQKLISERKTLEERLRSLVTFVYPSEANFVLIRDPRANQIYDYLYEAGFRIRRFDQPALQDCLRLSVGRTEENGKLVDLISTCLEGRP